jgi:exodeoxyribonuclease VIII
MNNIVELKIKTEIKEGVYQDMPFSQYNELDAIRSHDLTSFTKDPYTWKYEEKPDSEASFFVEGRLQHCLFLEPHVFHDEFVVAPKVDRRTKAGKAEYEDFLASVNDRSVVTQDLYDACQERVEVLDAFRPQAKDSTEVSIVFDYYGNRCKARFDMIQNNVIVDLKTCRDASPKGFKQAIKSYGYHQQAAFYLDAAASAGMTEVDRFHFLAISKQHPYPYAVYELSDEAIEYGRALNEKAIDQMKLCEDTGIYTPFNLHNKIIEIGISDL